MNWKKKALSALCVSAMACMGAGFLLGASAPSSPSVKGEDKLFYQSALYDWRLVGGRYKIENYSDEVRVFDPNGNAARVDETGMITLTVAGEYQIVYGSSTKRVTALYQTPKTELQLSFDLEESYPAGTALTLPALNAKNEAYDFEKYFLEVRFNGEHLETITVNEGESTVYLLKKDGAYQFTYFVLNDRGTRESVVKEVTATKEKAVLADELPASVAVGDKVELGWPYAYFDGEVYDVSVSVKKDGVVTPVTGQTFIPEYAGEYEVVYSAEIKGEKVSVSKYFTAVSPEEILFVSTKGNGENLGVQKLPSWSVNPSYEEGVLLKAETESASFEYTSLIDLSKLTKEDTLLAFVPYSSVEEDAYMEGLRVKFTDAHDSTRVMSLYFWATERYTGKNVPSSYATVEIGTSRFGIEHSDSRFGKLMSNTGAVADRASFMGAHNNYSDAFSVQYDPQAEVLYLTSQYHTYPRQQYVYLPLSDKGTLPDGVGRLPEQYWFKGFTTGEVYMSVEMVNNKNAGVYLCELAGKKASELTASFESNFLVFDQAITGLANGAVNYSYKLPSAHLNEQFEGTAEIAVTVKDANGNTVALQDGAFTPKTAGVYTAVYQTNYYGRILTKEYPFTVQEKPTDITVSVEAEEIAFGGSMSAPKITLEGGNGKLEYTYKVLLGGKEVENFGGKYPILLQGDLKIVVTAWDTTGYEKTAEFPVEVLDGAAFALEKAMPTAFKIGYPVALPEAVVTTLENGSYLKASVTLKIYENGEEKTLENGLFTPSKTATELRFVYEYSLGGEAYEKIYEAAVLPEEILSVTEYALTTGAVTKNITEAGILLGVGQGASTVAMPHAIAAEKLNITFGIHKASELTDEWEIILQDTAEESLALTLSVSAYNAQAATVSVALNGGSGVSLKGREYTYTAYCGNQTIVEKYAGTEYILFSLTFNFDKSAFLNEYTGAVVLPVNAFANGNTFVGFSNSTCKFSMRFAKSGASESELLLQQVGNQYFNYGEDSFGYFEADGVAPTIVIEGNKQNRSVAYGEKLIVPAAKAYDVLGGQCSVRVRIVANGETVLPAKDASQAFEYTLDRYASYAIIYESNDFSGNKTNASFNLTVIDEEKAEIIVQGNYQAKYKIGDKITVHAFTATDGQGGVYATVFIKDDQAKLTFLKAGDSYEFKKNGVYEIVYRAVDDAGNITRKAFKVVVE
jgi:hypothetical protein